MPCTTGERTLLNALTSAFRGLKLLVLLLSGALELILIRPHTPAERAAWLGRFCARMLRAMHIATRVEGVFPACGNIVSNHLGYLDILTYASVRPCIFVSKADLARVPLLGWITTMSGTVYVEPGRGGSALRAGAAFETAAQSGVPIVLFPEGGTSNGATILPFRTGALAQLVGSGHPITAAFVSYRLIRSNSRGLTVQDDVAFHGDAALIPHIFRILAVPGIEVTLRLAPVPIPFSPAALGDRKQAAVEARAAVMQLSGLREI